MIVYLNYNFIKEYVQQKLKVENTEGERERESHTTVKGFASQHK